MPWGLLPYGYDFSNISSKNMPLWVARQTYYVPSEAITPAFDPEAWLAEGRTNLDKLPEGVVLPAEPDKIQQARDIVADMFAKQSSANETPSNFASRAEYEAHIIRWAGFAREGAYDSDLAIQATFAALSISKEPSQ